MTWQTAHKLERVEITYHLPDDRLGRGASMTFHGCSSTKRGFLWTHSEAWDPGEAVSPHYEPSDLARHLLLVVEQDRPNTAARLAFGLTGGISYDEPGFWDD